MCSKLQNCVMINYGSKYIFKLYGMLKFKWWKKLNPVWADPDKHAYKLLNIINW